MILLISLNYILSTLYLLYSGISGGWVFRLTQGDSSYISELYTGTVLYSILICSLLALLSTLVSLVSLYSLLWYLWSGLRDSAVDRNRAVVGGIMTSVAGAVWVAQTAPGEGFSKNRAVVGEIVTFVELGGYRRISLFRLAQTDFV